MFRSISVINENELINRRYISEFLFQIMIQYFVDILIDVYDTLIFLQTRCRNDIFDYTPVDIVHVSLVLRIDSHLRNKLLNIEDVEIADIRYQRLQLTCWFRCKIYVHNENYSALLLSIFFLADSPS
jgi:hypothetical protein